LPLTLDVPIPEIGGKLLRIHLVGLFAAYVDPTQERPGSMGAGIHLLAERDLVFRQDLLCGRHYGDARVLEPVERLNGDGTSVETVGQCEFEGAPHRIDQLTVDVPQSASCTLLRFKDLGTVASFLLFDVLFEFQWQPTCPFRGRGGGVALSELGSIIRLADRARFGRALGQLSEGIRSASDPDEARSLGLTFVAVASAAMLELGASRAMHRVQLDAAREFESLEESNLIAERACEIVEDLVAPVMNFSSATGDALVDRALALLDRQFGRDLSDDDVAEQLGLSTSHFRHLFKQATGQPFHKYLIALRLEKARLMLLQQQIPVSDVAHAVGFSSAAHFSRAFQKRFAVAPSALRQARR
jgi:AraC-like DNA-binding protein